MTEALFVIDMQTDLLDAEGRFPVAQDQVVDVLAKTNQAIAGARERGIPVVYITNEFRPWDPGNLFRGGCCVRGRPGTELDPRVDVLPGAPAFEKWRGSAFCNEELGEWLAAEGVDSVALAGVYADACIRATTAGALKRGLRVTVLSDAVGAAGQRGRDAGLRKMRAAGADVASVAEWMDPMRSGQEGQMP
ncbi:MAG: hypothetical protein DRJ42_29455 [Deltaproteobacteria bacterium]|nr:MAG: hypothetical protein DRJ42_29455 [Deltaproteobacteria bacterium]